MLDGYHPGFYFGFYSTNVGFQYCVCNLDSLSLLTIRTLSLGALQYGLTYMIRVMVVPQAPNEFLDLDTYHCGV